jgi:hypothetical protein
MRILRSAACAIIAALAAPSLGLAQAGLQSIEADGTQFKVTMSDGRVLRSRDLVGATLSIAMGGAIRRIRIDAVETDPGDPAHGKPRGPQVFLHTMSIETADGSFQNICRPGPDGRRQAFPLAGRADADATIHPAEAGAFEITCTGGAQGKCVRFGYHPWENAPDGSNGRDLYNACVRMVRADYSGDGKGTTRNGMLIDLYDQHGIQQSDEDASLEFEAGWSKDGAVCVRHVRVKENVTLGKLEALPALHGRTGTICTEEFARAHGAVMFNRSRP